MLQLVYVSTAAPGVADADVQKILARSRANNARDLLTGLLYFDGKRFMQVLEGTPEALERAYERITADPRHRALVVVSRRTIEAREFGNWAMAYGLAFGEREALNDKVSAIIANASPAVRGIFEGFLSARRAA
ncbi:BLUF domain-containing protein [Sphingomonas koreensis]|nr:BLUF domain-containing protein [Sphingomonas koreensis]TPG43179.1 BLUF domain-containing protein [Sphingomonas koreensis]